MSVPLSDANGHLFTFMVKGLDKFDLKELEEKGKLKRGLVEFGLDWDVAEEKLALARELGAELTFNAEVEDPAAKIQEEIGGRHGVLIRAVSPPAFRQGIGMLRRGGSACSSGSRRATSPRRSSTWCSSD